MFKQNKQNKIQKNTQKVFSEKINPMSKAKFYADDLKNDLEISHQIASAIELISERALEIKYDTAGKPIEIVFAIGGPNIYLSLDEHPGCVIAYWDNQKAISAISNDIVQDLLTEIEEVYSYEK